MVRENVDNHSIIRKRKLKTGIQNRNRNRHFLIPVLKNWNRNWKNLKPVHKIETETEIISIGFKPWCIHVAKWWEQHYGGEKIRPAVVATISIDARLTNSRGPEFFLKCILKVYKINCRSLYNVHFFAAVYIQPVVGRCNPGHLYASRHQTCSLVQRFIRDDRLMIVPVDYSPNLIILCKQIIGWRPFAITHLF